MSKCELSLKVLQIANFSQITHSPTFGRAFTWWSFRPIAKTKMKNCEYLGKAISSPSMLDGRYTPWQWSWQKFLSPQKWWPFWIFKVFAKHKNAYISKTVLYGANSTKFLTCWVSLQSSHANFPNIFVSPNIADIFNFLIFCKTQKCLYLENCAT